MNPRPVFAFIVSPTGGDSFQGAAVLRERPHPVTQAPALQLGVPDDALGFRPEPGVTYQVRITDAGQEREFSSGAVWLERVQSSWWFILEPAGDPSI